MSNLNTNYFLDLSFKNHCLYHQCST